MNLQNRYRLTENEFMVTMGEWCGEGIVREFGMDMYTLLYLKWITSKDLLYSTQNSAQCYVEAWMGGGFGGEPIHMYLWLSPFAIHLKLSQHCKSAMRTCGLSLFIRVRLFVTL